MATDRKAEKHAYYVANRERHQAYARDWKRAHPERARAMNRASDARRRQQRHVYYITHRVDVIARNRRHRRVHPEMNTANVARRRALRAGNGGSHSLAEWLWLVAMFGGRCAYCGRDRPLTRDHRVPLTRGGTDDIANILPACRSCNAAKGAKG